MNFLPNFLQFFGNSRARWAGNNGLEVLDHVQALARYALLCGKLLNTVQNEFPAKFSAILDENRAGINGINGLKVPDHVPRCAVTYVFR